MAVTRWDRRASKWARNLARAFRDRHGRRARALASVLDGFNDNHKNNNGDEFVVRPWEFRLPRVAVLAAARARGFEPVGGLDALVERGAWLEPMRFTRMDQFPEAAVR